MWDCLHDGSSSDSDAKAGEDGTYWVGKAVRRPNASKDKSSGSVRVCVDQQRPRVPGNGRRCEQDLIAEWENSKTVANKSAPVCGVDPPNSCTPGAAAAEANVVKALGTLDTWHDGTIDQHEGRGRCAAERRVGGINKFVECNSADCGDKVIGEYWDGCTCEPVGRSECYVEVAQDPDTI